jgi:hypothetical protein
VYNTSIGAAYGGTPHSIAQRFNEILAARPDMVLWVLTPWDLDHASDLHPQDIYLRAEAKGETAQSVPPKISASPLHRVAAAVGMESAMTFLYDGLKSFRFRTLLSHYLFESRSMYVNSYLKNDDEMVGFLKSDWGPGWKDRINEFDVYAAEIENRSAAAGIPLVAVLVPNRAQAAMISMGTWPQGYDPYKIDYELQSVITRHGGTYIDIFPPFRTIPNPEDHYMPVDGHPDAEGHAMISNLIANVLTRGAVPAIRAASGPDGALETMK